MDPPLLFQYRKLHVAYVHRKWTLIYTHDIQQNVELVTTEKTVRWYACILIMAWSVNITVIVTGSCVTHLLGVVLRKVRTRADMWKRQWSCNISFLDFYMSMFFRGKTTRRNSNEIIARFSLSMAILYSVWDALTNPLN